MPLDTGILKNDFGRRLPSTTPQVSSQGTRLQQSLLNKLESSGPPVKPKGVEIPRRALTNFLWAMRDLLRLTEADRVLAIMTVSSIGLYLKSGFRCTLGCRSSCDDAAGGKLLRALIDITFMRATPSRVVFFFWLVGKRRRIYR